MGTGTVLILAACGCGGARRGRAGVPVAPRARARRPRSARLDRLLAETGRAREAAQSVDRRFDELRRAVDGRVEGVEKRLAAGQQSVSDHLGKSTHLMKELGERLGRLHEASQKIEKLAGDVTRLEDLLKPPKLRGTLGEMFLEQALAQVLPPAAFATQHPLGDGVVVDAVVFVQDRMVPIDSKFPLENFRRARENEDESERRRARQQFGRDVRRHVDAIAERYIRPASGTCDFALMYVPAEAVYAEIVADEEGGALADYAATQARHPGFATPSLCVHLDRGARTARDGAAGERPRSAPEPFRARPPLGPRRAGLSTSSVCICRTRRSSTRRPRGLSTGSRRAWRRSPRRPPTEDEEGGESAQRGLVLLPPS